MFTSAVTWNLETIVLSEVRRTPGHMSPDSVHRIYPEQVNHRDGSRLVWGGAREMTAEWDSAGGDKALGLENSDSRTALCVFMAQDCKL